MTLGTSELGPQPVAAAGRIGTRAWLHALRPAAIVALLALAFLADLDTGYDLSASLFYMLPIALAAWFLGRPAGLALAVASAAAWTAAQLLAVQHGRPSGPLLANAGLECAIYLATAWVVARVREDRATERALTARATEARDTLEREFQTVGRLQRDLLPRALPPVDGWEWHVHYATSTRAGGDYYDAFALPDGRVALTVADASGHGAPAAVLMAMAKALLAAEPDALAPPGAVLARLDARLARVLPPGWFLTACHAVIEPASGRLTYSLAGHEPPLVVRARDGSVDRLPQRGGPPLGPFVLGDHPEGAAVLAPGDTLVLFTDGVTETVDPARELFGVERLCETLRDTASRPLADVSARVLAALAGHARGAPAEDDITLVLLRRPPDTGHRADGLA